MPRRATHSERMANHARRDNYLNNGYIDGPNGSFVRLEPGYMQSVDFSGPNPGRVIQVPIPNPAPALVAPPMPPRPPQLNPAERALVQAEAKEGKEIKEAADALPAHRGIHKGMRKSYIPSNGNWLTKPELLEKIIENELSTRGDNPNRYRLSPEELNKKIAREKFSLLKQYNLSKHEPTGNPDRPFGNMLGGGKASEFLYGSYPRVTGWRDMSPAQQDAFMAQDMALKNTPERIAEKEARRQAAQFREYERQTEQQTQRRANLSPAEREQEDYNRQLSDYFNQQHRYDYQNQIQSINQNRQTQEQSGFNRNVPVPQPVLNELISMMNSQPTRYVPVRPRPSINDRVMNSFGQNMFSPEFILEEE